MVTGGHGRQVKQSSRAIRNLQPTLNWHATYMIRILSSKTILSGALKSSLTTQKISILLRSKVREGTLVTGKSKTGITARVQSRSKKLCIGTVACLSHRSVSTKRIPFIELRTKRPPKLLNMNKF